MASSLIERNVQRSLVDVESSTRPVQLRDAMFRDFFYIFFWFYDAEVKKGKRDARSVGRIAFSLRCQTFLMSEKDASATLQVVEKENYYVRRNICISISRVCLFYGDKSINFFFRHVSHFHRYVPSDDFINFANIITAAVQSKQNDLFMSLFIDIVKRRGIRPLSVAQYFELFHFYILKNLLVFHFVPFDEADQ